MKPDDIREMRQASWPALVSRHVYRAVVVAFCMLAVAVPAPATAFEVGVFDPEAGRTIPGLATSTLQLAKASGASIVRVQVDWRSVAITEPSVAADPADLAYRWSSVDAAVNEATRVGLKVILSASNAPSWAEGTDHPASARPGSWKPRPTALGNFMTALARRYPGVRTFQVWNEPNLDFHLSPQWIRSGSGYMPFAPIHYRAMLNAAYGAIKAVNPRNRVVTAGTAPYGDPLPGGNRTTPVRFWRSVLCLDALLRKRGCPDRAHFDVLAHHPYGIGGPRRRALNGDDAAVPDLGKVSRVLRAARKQRTVLPAAPKRLWVTEISWDSSPPDPYGVPERRHANWLTDALYVLWNQRIDVVLWFRTIDQAPVPDYGATNQSGLYLRSGVPKVAERAFAFPFTCARAGRAHSFVWGMAPVYSSPVSVQARYKRGWRTLHSLRVRADRTFRATIPTGATRLRATQGPRRSLSRACYS